MNKSIISGLVGSDPQLKEMYNGAKVARFDVRVTKEYVDGNGESQEKVLWFRVEAWNKLAEYVEKNLTKNKMVLVEGEWDIEKWFDEAGNPKIKYLINPERIETLN